MNPQSVGTESPAAGSVLTFDTKGAIAYYSRAGWPVCGGGGGQAGGCAARRQGEGDGHAPAGALGEGRWGAFFESAEEGAAGSEIQPYRKRAGGGNGRLGDRSPTGNAPGSEDSAYRVAAQVAAVFRGWLGILRGSECGLLAGASS